MSKVDFVEYSQNLNIDDIFDRKIKIGAVIQFSLLQNIIEEFIKRQKSMNDKINILESKFESISNIRGITNIYNNSNICNDINDELNKLLINNSNYSNESYNKNNNIKENIIEENEEKKVKKIEKEINNENEKLLVDGENLIELKDNNLNPEKKENDDKQIYNENTNKNISTKDLSYRVKKLELINNELIKKIISFNNNNKNNIQKLSDNFGDKIKLQNNNINKISNDIKSLESKIVLLSSILKLDENNNSNNNQISTLFHSLDEKISKKILSLEEHNKDNEEQIIRLKKEIIISVPNLRNINQINIQSSNNIKSNYQSLLNDFNELRTKYEKEINELNKITDDKISEVKANLLNQSIEQNKKISDVIIEQDNLKEKVQNKNIDNNLLLSLINEAIEKMSNELKHYFNKGLLDNENKFKSIFNELGVEKIKDEIIKINQELQNRLIQKDISPINYKLDEIDTKIVDLKNNNEDFSNKIEELNNENIKNQKLVESLTGKIFRSYRPDLDIKDNYAENNKLFVKKDIYEEEITKILKKIEKLFEFENENNKYIQTIEEKLENYVTDKDLKNVQHYIMNIIEELKILVNKKYIEKKEAEKSFKILQLQIKTINENINANPSLSSGDNWLLAKKPINNYICASCESYIGDLKNKNDYLPWNKLTPKEGKKYRMGQGFSRMLQMVNMDLLKNAEKINDDLSIKFEENQNNKNNNKNKQFPRLNSSKNIRKIKTKNKDLDNNNLEMKESNNELNRSNINTVLDSSKYYNYNSVGNNSNNSIDVIKDYNQISKFKKIYKAQSPRLSNESNQTFTKIYIKNKNV